MKILKFYSPTCGPCKLMDKNLKEAGVEYTNVNILEDTIVDENGEEVDLIEVYGIKTIPTLIKIDSEDNIIAKSSGVMTVEQIKTFCNDKND